MTYKGKVKDGVVVVDEPANLPEGAEVRIELTSSGSDEPVLDENGQTLGQKLMKFAGTVKGMPSDMARNHDHYIHGTPKK
jgi:hypothetical protein